MVAIIIPTCRNVDNLKAWDKYFKNVTIYVIEDHPKKQIKIPKIQAKVKHLCHKDIDKDLGKNSWIITKYSSSIYSYGILKALEDGHNYFICMDDDVYPVEDEMDFVNHHLNHLIFTEFNSNRWFNHFKAGFPRGFPYSERNRSEVVLNQGLWYGSPDINAMDNLAKVGVNYYNDSLIVPKGQYWALSSMNYAFKKKIIYTQYHPKAFYMNDVWCGIMTKKILDHLGYSVRVGQPYIIHKQEKRDWVELADKQMAMVKENEKFWKEVDKIKLKGKDVRECYLELMEGLAKSYPELSKAGIRWVGEVDKKWL